MTVGRRLGTCAGTPGHGHPGGALRRVAQEFPKATFFAGQLIFQQPRWWHGILHSGTARAIQERLQWAGRAMVTLPIRVREAG